MFDLLRDQQVTNTLMQLYRKALKQGPSLIWHFLPKAYRLLSKKGAEWKGENESFYDDKYIPIHPAQGDYLYLQARAINAKTIFEFGTSYGISTIYLAKAAKDNGGKVITTEYLPHKVAAARKNLEAAGLADYVTFLEGDARETVRSVTDKIDMALLDGWPDLVNPIFRLIEPLLNNKAIILIDDVEGFRPAMQDYLDYVRNPANGYISTTIPLVKGIEFTVKL